MRDQTLSLITLQFNSSTLSRASQHEKYLPALQACKLEINLPTAESNKSPLFVHCIYFYFYMPIGHVNSKSTCPPSKYILNQYLLDNATGLTPDGAAWMVIYILNQYLLHNATGLTLDEAGWLFLMSLCF